MKTLDADTIMVHATPLAHQKAHEIQPFGHLVRMPIALSEVACKESVDNLNQLLADEITLRDLYKKHHWQVAGPTFMQLHLLFDKHAGEQTELVDALAERIQTLGGVCVAMAHDVAETTLIPAPEGARGSADPDFSSPSCSRDCHQGGASDGAPGRGERRRWHQRSTGKRRDSAKRTAGLVSG